MKTINTILFSLIFMLLSSCAMKTEADNSEIVTIGTDDCVGLWLTTTESVKKVRKGGKPANEIITSIRLFSDSNAVVFYQVAQDMKIEEGRWKWVEEKTLGTDVLSATITGNVELTGPGYEITLLPESNDGKMTLTVDDYLLEKQKK